MTEIFEKTPSALRAKWRIRGSKKQDPSAMPSGGKGSPVMPGDRGRDRGHGK